MKKIFLLVSLLLVFVFGGLLSMSDVRQFFSDMSMPFRHDMIRVTGIMVEMRDGVKLNTRVYRPLSFDSEQYPTILMRTTYGAFDFNQTKRFVENGYVVVEQFVRGRYGSEGNYSPHRYSGRDGYDTIDWIIQQPWSNRKVGTFGCSYLGEVQIALAKEKHPNHVAAIADAGAGLVGKLENNYGYFGFFENGVLNLVSSVSWFARHGSPMNSTGVLNRASGRDLLELLKELPVSQLDNRLSGTNTIFDDFLTNDLSSDWWELEGYVTDSDTFTTPTLHVNAWFDQGIQGTFDLQKGMSRNALNEEAEIQSVLIGPGNHCESGKLKTGDLKIGEMTVSYRDIDYWKVYLDWFGYWLKDGDGALPEPVTYFEIHGEGWRSEDTWAEGSEHKKYYFSEEGRLKESADQAEGQLSFDYDPSSPVPSLGGAICCTQDAVSGPVPQNPLFEREDTLVFTSELLMNSLVVRGSPIIHLSVSSNAVDTDFNVWLLDIYPDGKAYGVNDSVIRMRYRDSYNAPALMEPGEIYDVALRLRPMAYKLREGHRLGVMISSSNFPRLARNLNTGKHEYLSDEVLNARNSVYFGKVHSSYLDLPLVSSDSSLNTKPQ